MRRRFFLTYTISLAFFMVIGRNVLAHNSQFTPLIVSRPRSYPGLKEFRIVKPGKYCFSEDHIQRSSYLDSDGNRHRPMGGVMLALFCGNVEIDFQGHVLGADAEMGGISQNAATNTEMGKRREGYSGSVDNRNVVLRNGIIDLARGERTGKAVVFAETWRGHNLRNIGRPDDGGGRLLTVEYTRNDHRLDAMKILANKVAVTIEGSYTVIRGCIIESSDFATVFLAGDHVLIENCEIRLRKAKKLSPYPRAAIVLRDGSHSIIRNNRIRVDYSEGDSDAYCILVGDGAVDVIIENNTFINAKESPTLFTEGATAVVRDNKFEKRWGLI